MFKKILLPVDLSNHHGPAFEIGVNLARLNQGEIVLFHIIELIGITETDLLKYFAKTLESSST